MTSPSVQLREYLLGRQPRPNLSALDLEIAESNLIDEYALGALSPSDRDAFEQNFLNNDDRRERFAMAKAIVRMSARQRSRRRLVTAIGGSAVAAIGAFFYIRASTEPAPVLTLVPNSTRGAEPPSFLLRSAPATIVIELKIFEPTPPCKATITRIGEPSPILTMILPQQRQASVRIAIQKTALIPGDYSVSLSNGAQFQQDFVFQVL